MKQLSTALFLLFAAAAAVAQSGFQWQFDAEIKSRLGYGTLSQAVTSAPGEFGADAVLSAADLLAAGNGFTEQLSFGSQLDAAAVMRWEFDQTALEATVSAGARHAQYGYWPDSGVLVAPGPTGVRFVWGRRDPEEWGFAVGGGRFYLSDSTGMVVDQLVDGVSLSGGNRSFYLRVDAGLTGLVDRFLFSPRVAPGDAEVFEDAVVLAPNRLLMQIRTEAAVTADHSVALSTLLYEDLLPDLSATYLLVQLAGQGSIVRFEPLGQTGGGLSHTSQVVVQTALPNAAVGLLASSRIELRAAGRPLMIGLDALFASGGDGLRRYLPLNSAPLGQLVAVPAQNVIRLALDGRVFATLLERPVEPALSASLFLIPDPEPGESAFLAVETVGTVDYALLNDLSVHMLAGFAVSPVGLSPLFSLSGRLTL